MKLNTDRKIGLFAMSGYGKSTLGNFLIESYSQKVPVIIYNTDYEDLKFNSKNVIVLAPDVHKVDDLEYLNRIIRKLRSKYSNFMLYIRDIDVFFDDKKSADKFAKELKNLASTGRHQRIGLIYESKQLKYMPLKVISNTNLIFFGNFSEVDDVKRLKNFAAKKEITSLKSPAFIMYDRITNERFLVHLDMERGKLVNDMKLKDLSEII